MARHSDQGEKVEIIQLFRNLVPELEIHLADSASLGRIYWLYFIETESPSTLSTGLLRVEDLIYIVCNLFSF